jgi:hypothetical protein
MSPRRNSLAGLLADLYPPPPNRLHPQYVPPRTVLTDLMDYRPKTEWVSGHYKVVSYGLLGQRYEWVPGYWRRSAW